jgi:hypothetical protein
LANHMCAAADLRFWIQGMQHSNVAGIHIAVRKDRDTPMTAKALIVSRGVRCGSRVRSS